VTDADAGYVGEEIFQEAGPSGGDFTKVPR
jgi:hypothetical protein